MTDYYANVDVAAYAVLRTNYDAEYEHWNATMALVDDAYAVSMDAFNAAHDAWVDDPNDELGEPLPEPVAPDPPTYPPEPVPPTAPSTRYSAQQVQTLTTIDTVTGPALVVPGRYVLNDGTTAFALSESELEAHYTDASAPLPQVTKRVRR